MIVGTRAIYNTRTLIRLRICSAKTIPLNQRGSVQVRDRSHRAFKAVGVTLEVTTVNASHPVFEDLLTTKFTRGSVCNSRFLSCVETRA